MPWINGCDADIPIIREDGTPSAGFHVHLPCWPQTPADFRTARPELADYLVEPASLQRVFAGDEDPSNPQLTVALRFPDEATAQLVLAPLGYWTPVE